LARKSKLHLHNIFAVQILSEQIMVEIYPTIDFVGHSPYGDGRLLPKKIIWQGIHTCVETKCNATGKTVITDIPVGHAVTYPCAVNLSTKEIFCQPDVHKWLGEPLLNSFEHPATERIPVTIEVFKRCSRVIILNCIDNYYGHSLLKLFNAERHLDVHTKFGLIILIQKNYRWLVPDGVAEIWTVDIPLSNAHHYYSSVDEQIQQECKRFKQVFVSKAYSHPRVNDITRYTRCDTHNFQMDNYRITYIWRNDRPWINNIYLVEAARKLNIFYPLLIIQNIKVRRLFGKLRNVFPNIRFSIVGLGKKTSFPSWIEDLRTTSFTESQERNMCGIYAESRLVVGVHGSNMLLPSAHSGMTLDLMPSTRWANIAQDIIYQEHDIRMASYRYRFVPLQTSTNVLAHIIQEMLLKYSLFKQQMQNPDIIQTV